MKKLLLLAAATSLMAACADSTTAPTPRQAAPDRAHTDFECRSGYIVAYDENGNPYCAPAPDGGTTTTLASPKTSRP